MHNTLQYLFQYKAWADDELLTALSQLGAESPITQLAIKALSHTYVVDQIFAAHLRGKNHAYTSANLSQCPGSSFVALPAHDLRVTPQSPVGAHQARVSRASARTAIVLRTIANDRRARAGRVGSICFASASA